jgi:hypothetical protein
MSDWGKGVINNIGWGQGANNDIGWGSIYDKSNAGETLLSGGGVFNNAFTIEVKTDNAGTSNDNQFQFTGAEGDYDVVAKQNGIVVANFNDLSGEETITLPSSGVYVLEVSAKEVNGFNRISFNNGGDNLKITDIKQWGNVAWSSFSRAFFGCSNMLITATDIPNLINVNIMFVMLLNATIANINMRSWDVSGIINMDRIFQNTNLSVENLTACYENWSQLNLQQNVSFGAGTTRYLPSGQEGRDILVNTYNWTIEDGGLV